MRRHTLALDPTARRRAEEERILHTTTGPVRVDVLGELAWAIGDPDLLRWLLTDHRVVKDRRRYGDRPDPGRPTAHDQAHHRIRDLLAPVFAPDRPDVLPVTVERNTSALLADLSENDDPIVDLRAAYAVELSVRVLADLLGIPADGRGVFRRALDRMLEDSAATSDPDVRAMTEFMSAATAGESGPAETLVLAIGHEALVNLIGSAIAALLVAPEQRGLVRAGRATWSDVVEETLRVAAPMSHHRLMRYAVEDIELPGGRTIAKGDVILPSYGAASNNPKYAGADSTVFDVTRADKSHLAFGHGTLACPSARLARIACRTALVGLFGLFPAIELAVPAATLEPSPSLFGNGHAALPVYLHGRR
ncbi:cytochrome P450 [Actinoplanes sp. HUAS TT8]|uniref:cytochrome P450 n=1 Tax=Actinoplanes sp. HUAS TT8 TaxID=3447453 RepID=UPI003F524E1C